MLKNVTLNFNLRQPRKKGMTPIYAVVRVGKKQYKVPTGCRIKPWQWDEKKQLPRYNIDKEDEANAIKVINTISQFRLSFQKSFLYLCFTTDVPTITLIKRLTMTNKIASQKANAGAKATSLMERAFTIYYIENPDVKETTRKVMRDRLSSYLTFLTETGDTVKRLTQRGINEFRDYLVYQRESGSRRISNAQINNLCNVVARLVKVIATHTEFSHYNINKVEYQPLKEIKPKNEWKKRRPLTEQEITALLTCRTLTPQEQEYRDLFIMECECGCRISDMPKLFNQTAQKHFNTNGKEVISIDTQKEHIRAYILVTDIMKGYITRYADNGFMYAHPDNTRTFTNKYNRIIRNVARKAGLTGVETFKDANGNIKTVRLCDIISSHFARYTFIRKMLQQGYSADELRRLTGHADTTMINEVYNVHNDDDEANAVFRAHDRVSGTTADNTCEQQQSTALTTYLLHCRDILAWLGEPRESYVGISHPQELARLIAARYEVPLAGMGWNVEKIESLYKTNDVQGYERLKSDIKRLRLTNSLNQQTHA